MSFFRDERDAYVLGLLRLALSALLLLTGARWILELVRNGYFGDFFHISLLPEAWLPTASGYALILGAQVTAAAFALLGLWPREALLGASSLGLFVLTLDRLQYHNNRYALLLLGFLLAFAPCDRSFSIARIARGKAHALPDAERVAPTFARYLFQIQVSLVYLGSACGKLFDGDWRGGQVLLVRFASTASFLDARGITLPHWLESVLASAWFASLAAKAAISSELFIALGLWFPRTRRLGLWIGVWFHFWIEVSARVELFSWLMVASYLAFVVPEIRQRRLELDPQTALGRTLARALPVLDWCARFQIVERRGGPSFTVTSRDGRAATDLAGVALLAEAVPVLFPLWLPLALVAKARARRASCA